MKATVDLTNNIGEITAQLIDDPEQIGFVLEVIWTRYEGDTLPDIGAAYFATGADLLHDDARVGIAAGKSEKIAATLRRIADQFDSRV